MKRLFLVLAILFLFPALSFALSPAMWGGTAAAEASKTLAYVAATNSASTGVTTTATAGTSNTTGNTLIVACGNETAGPVHITGIADTATNTYTLINHAHNGNDSAELWFATNITGNANNVVTVTWAANASYASCVIYEFSGLGTATVDTSAILTGTGTTPNAAVTTGSAVALLISGAYTANSASSSSAGAGYTMPAGARRTYNAAEYQITTATGTYNGDFTGFASGAWACVQGSLK
jgi:hypothetical protein